MVEERERLDPGTCMGPCGSGTPSSPSSPPLGRRSAGFLKGPGEELRGSGMAVYYDLGVLEIWLVWFSADLFLVGVVFC